MTLPTHKQLMLSEIASNEALKVAHIQAERQHAQTLQEAGFTTAAFLHLWIVTEVAAKELMSIYKYTKDTPAALNKLKPKLKHALIKNLNHSPKKLINAQASQLTDQALPALSQTLCDIFKKSYTSDFIRLDIKKIELALTLSRLPVDKAILKYLLASTVKALPDGYGLKDKTTVRTRRNKLVHSNRQIDEAIWAELLPVFDYFFDLLAQLQQLANASLQPDLKMRWPNEPTTK